MTDAQAQRLAPHRAMIGVLQEIAKDRLEKARCDIGNDKLTAEQLRIMQGRIQELDYWASLESRILRFQKNS